MQRDNLDLVSDILGFKRLTGILCYDVEDNTSSRSAIAKILAKYPKAVFYGCDELSYLSLESLNAELPFYAVDMRFRSGSSCVQSYNIVGILCGTDRTFPEIDRRIMRC